MLNLIWKNNKLVWTKELSVGNAIIDTEHKNLICITNEIAYAIRARDCHAIEQSFEKLESWLNVHFLNEEQIAAATKIDFSKHRSQQQHALKELQYMKDELLCKDGVWSDNAVDHFTRSLKYWMIDKHIIELDMKMKPTLENYPYDFMPT